MVQELLFLLGLEIGHNYFLASFVRGLTIISTSPSLELLKAAEWTSSQICLALLEGVAATDGFAYKYFFAGRSQISLWPHDMIY